MTSSQVKGTKSTLLHRHTEQSGLSTLMYEVDLVHLCDEVY